MATISDGMTTLSEVQVGDIVELPMESAATGPFTALCTSYWMASGSGGTIPGPRWTFGDVSFSQPAIPVRIVARLGYRED